MHKQTVTARDSTTRAMYIFRLAMLCLIVASISACSMLRIGYEFVPWYAAWQLDRYWRLDAAQASFAKERIDDLWRWHRRSELPEYARWLRSSSAHLDAPVGLTEVTGWRQTAVRHWRAVVLRVAPDLAEMILTLRPEQIEQMKRRMASENDDYKREFLPEGPAQRQSRRIKRIEEKIEYFFGALTDLQRDIIQRMASAMPRNEQVWFDERLARQQDFLRLAERLSRFGPTLADVQRQEATRLTTEYLNSVWQPGDPQRRQALEDIMLASDEITVAVFNTARPEQKARLSERLLRWAVDFEALSG